MMEEEVVIRKEIYGRLMHDVIADLFTYYRCTGTVWPTL